MQPKIILNVNTFMPLEMLYYKHNLFLMLLLQSVFISSIACLHALRYLDYQPLTVKLFWQY